MAAHRAQAGPIPRADRSLRARALHPRPVFHMGDRVVVRRDDHETPLRGTIVGIANLRDEFDWWCVDLAGYPNPLWPFGVICISHDRISIDPLPALIAEREAREAVQMAVRAMTEPPPEDPEDPPPDDPPPEPPPRMKATRRKARTEDGADAPVPPGGNERQATLFE